MLDFLAGSLFGLTAFTLALYLQSPFTAWLAVLMFGASWFAQSDGTLGRAGWWSAFILGIVLVLHLTLKVF